MNSFQPITSSTTLGIMNAQLFEDYVSDSNECVKFKLVTSLKDLEEDFDKNETQSKHEPRIKPFKPQMSYQFFGDNENIFGYKNLSIKLYYSCAKLNIYMGIDYDHKLNRNQTDGVEADNVKEVIASKYETKICNNLNEFSVTLSQEKSFVPYGDLLTEFSIEQHPQEDQAGGRRFFRIYKAHNSLPGFLAYHERMQTFLMWFIEASTYIDIDDDRWDFFIIYELLSTSGKYEERLPNEYQYCFVGYSTVYRYYAYPSHVRPRISQFLILPPFQRLGLGTRLLEAIYAHYNNTSTVDIHVEEPGEQFQIMQDIVDCKLCQQLDSFATNKLKQGFSREMAKEARAKYKMNYKQVRRVYEILRLKATNRSDEKEYREYRLAIKNRFNSPYKRQLKTLEKLKSKIPEQEYAKLLKAHEMPLTVRISMLSKMYETLESEYLLVLDKLN